MTSNELFSVPPKTFGVRKLSDWIRVLEPADYRRMRWKNGGGWTTEIAVYPHDAGLTGKPFDWRVSLAEIENDGEFSVFPGYDRTILLAEGAGMELSFDAASTQRIAEYYMPFSFKGEWRCHCHLLNGPVRDFNVMTARAAYRHQCEIVRSATFPLSVTSPEQTLLMYCFHGEVGIQASDQPDVKFKSGETLCLSVARTRQQPHIAFLEESTVLALVTFYAVMSQPVNVNGTGE